MRVLIYSRAFLPHIGGLELNVAHLAEELMKRGWEVRVATVTPADGPDELPYAVIRNPAPRALLKAVRWCDVYHQPNLSLRGLWPLLLVRRPWVVSHHSWYTRTDGTISWKDRIKRLLVRFADGSIAVSQAIADDLRTPCTVVPNSYREDLFVPLQGIPRDRDLIFVGRLVSDKGVDILLEALRLLARNGLRPTLSIVGEGPEEPRLRELVSSLELEGQVAFLGLKRDKALVEAYHRHRIAVVPSRYNEPFGIVALEAIACGCAVVGSAGGGLSEAFGPCGVGFPNGDAKALAARLEQLLLDPAHVARLLENAPGHLAAHSSPAVFGRYARILDGAVIRRST